MSHPSFVTPARDASPRLPFGEHLADRTTPFDPVRSRLAPHPDHVRNLHVTDLPDGATGRLVELRIGEQDFLALDHPAFSLDLDAGGGHLLLMPRTGGARCATGTSHFDIRAGQGVAYLSGAPRRLELERGATVVVPLDRARLLRTAAAMFGPDETPGLALDDDRALALHAGRLPLARMFGHLFELFDTVSPDGLTRFGLDDVFYRYTVGLLCPTLTDPPAGSDTSASQGRRRVEALCAQVRECLPGAVTLSALERISGLSQRSLQLLFRKHLGCTPMQWVRQARLDRVRERLLQARFGDTVTKVALDCGFAQLGGFAQAYRERFGEQPSDTLRRTLLRH